MKHIKELIGQSKIAEAIKEALTSDDLKDHQHSILLISGQYEKNESDKNIGILDWKDYELTRNRIANSILTLIHKIESDNEIGINSPIISDETKNNFQLLTSLFAGEKGSNAEFNRVKSLSWSNTSEFLVTSCLSSNTLKIWHVNDGRLAFTIKSQGKLSTAQFDEYDSSIWSIENNRCVVIWKKRASSINRYGVTWEREKEIHLPSHFIEPYIKAILYKVDLKDTYTYALVQDKNSDINRLMRFKRGYILDKGISYFDYADESIYYNAKLKYLKGGKHEELAVMHGDKEITIFTSNTEESTIKIFGYDVVSGESNKSFIYISLSINYLPITLWNANLPEPVPLKYSRHWTSTFYSKLITHGSFFLIENNREKIFTSGMHGGELYSFTHQFNKNGDIDAIYGSKWGEHKKKITRIDLSGPAFNFDCQAVTTSSEDGTIRIWYKNEIGRILNCHPHIHPFQWCRIDGEYVLAYADVDGYVHIVKFIHDPFDRERRDEKIEARVWSFLRKPLNLIIIICFIFLARMIIFGENDRSLGSFIFVLLPIIYFFALRRYLRRKIEGY